MIVFGVIVVLKVFNSPESNMKWILIILLVFYCGPNDSATSVIGIEKRSSPATNTRNARTLEFSSEEEYENGIHLHIWNDISNKNSFYPNLMKYVAEESVKKDSNSNSASTKLNDSDHKSSPTHIHIDLNELVPTPQPQVSAVNLLKNALVHTLELDEFRKSDQNLYGSFYKLKSEKPNSIGWNYHPSAVNYIPRPYNTNLDVIPPSAPVRLAKSSSPTITTTLRPTLHDQMRTTGNLVPEYYTNLPKTKPKSVIESVGYEIGGLPKYSGRLLANEPMPQQYRTFKMFEPVPRQIMLPPLASHHIPEFKPVPPRLKIIPVIDDLLESANRLVVDDISKSLPWNLVKTEQNSKPKYLLPVMIPKKLQMIPFKINDAITVAPFHNYLPETEYNHIEPSTETYHRPLLSPDIETLRSNQVTQHQINPSTISTKFEPTTTTSKAPKFNGYSLNQYDAQRSNDSILMYGQYRIESKPPLLINEHNEQYSSDYGNNIPQNREQTVLIKPAPLGNSRIQKNNQQMNENNIDFVHAAKKNPYKKSKTMHKPQQPSSDQISINDVTNSNWTGFSKIQDNDCNNAKNSDSVFGLGLDSSKNGRQNVLIDSVPSNTIQLSQTYSKSNVQGVLPLPTTTTTATETTNTQDEYILQQLTNDVKKALLTSLGNDTNSNDHDASTSHDPFLIAVYDENVRDLQEGTNTSEDLQFAETVTKTSESLENIDHITNSSIQRMDQMWATDRWDTTDKRLDKRVQSKFKTKAKTKTKIELNNITKANNSSNNSIKISSNNSSNTSSIDEKYYKWFSQYAEENRKHGRTVISEHFKKVKIEPNITWLTLPR